MYSILADLIAALAAVVFFGGMIWLATARITDEPFPTAAVIVTITAAIVGIVAVISAAGLRAAHRRETR
jgi:hypothetical protein